MALVFGLLAFGASGSEVNGEDRENSPAVNLPTFRVVADWFSVRVTVNSKTGITQVLVTDVTKESKAWNFGLRKNYRLLEINHVSVLGLSDDKFVELLNKAPDIDSPHILTFRRTRGFIINYTNNLTITITYNPPKPETKQ